MKVQFNPKLCKDQFKQVEQAKQGKQNKPLILFITQIHPMFTSASFKLQKLNRSMELKSNSSKTQSTLFTPRMSSNISIAKSVKYNDIQFITGQELCKLRRQPQQPSDNPQFSTAKNNMTNIKKRYDQTNHSKMYLSNKIQRLNEEKQKLLSLVNEFQSNKSTGKNKVTLLEDSLESIKLQLLDKQFEKMSMTQMRDVIVHDKIVYDKKKYDLEKQLQKIFFKSKSIKQANIHQSEEDDRTLKVYEKLISKLDNQNKQRQQHLNSIESRVIEKEGIQNSSVLRKSQMMSIAETTMCERDPQEKEWINIFMTHKLLKDLLETKIEREMLKFSEVENAFKNIKIATGVNDAHTLVKKFLSKEEVYGDLLSKITENEREIQVLRMDKERFLKEIKKTEEELQELQAIKTYDEDLREWLKEAEYYEERKRRSEYQDMKLKQYLFKQLKRLGSQENSNSEKDGMSSHQNANLTHDTKEEIKQKFMNHLKHLSNMIDQTEKLQITNNNESQNNSNSLISQQAISKIFRVKPHIQVNAQSTNDKNLSPQYIQPYEQEQITTANDEVDAVDQQRMSLLKGNEKFMRQLKRKIQEQKQLMIETLVKNSKQKAPAIPVKKVQPPQQ